MTTPSPSPTNPRITADSQIGTELRRLRRRAGWTQDELAKIAGVSRGRIDAIENGRSDHMRFATVMRLLEAFGHEIRICRSGEGDPA